LRQVCAENGESVLTQLRATNGAVVARWLVAFESDAHDRFIDLTVQLRKNLELMAKLTKELAPAQTNIALHAQVAIGPFERPEYVDAIATIVGALRPFPEARQAVAEALRAFEIARVGGPLIEAKPVKPA
jgi:hypothetical protein